MCSRCPSNRDFLSGILREVDDDKSSVVVALAHVTHQRAVLLRHFGQCSSSEAYHLSQARVKLNQMKRTCVLHELAVGKMLLCG